MFSLYRESRSLRIVFVPQDPEVTEILPWTGGYCSQSSPLHLKDCSTTGAEKVLLVGFRFSVNSEGSVAVFVGGEGKLASRTPSRDCNLTRTHT